MYFVQGLEEKIHDARVLLVGAGGIGCEVLKNLTLSGFKNIDTVDLDTIDVSNLNRQFLFNKTNVGQSKAKVATDIASCEYSATLDGLNLRSFHKSIMDRDFDTDFYREYTFVINALDNRAARSHVNRMCLSANVPLLESGTEGYLGQTMFIKGGLTACYECEGLQKDGRTYATCTIRNTPSQPIHCIVWAKHLCHQLFGEDDPDNDVSPQMEENKINNNVTEPTSNEEKTVITNGNNHNEKPKIITTREWAVKNNYNPLMLFEKLFNKDILYLLSMKDLWKERAKPIPLEIDTLENCQESLTVSSKKETKLENQRLWTLKECLETFNQTVVVLKKRMEASGFLEWDKDDEVSLKFVTAASNLRSKNFNIERKSLFDVKSLAGNIVPAISSTNSIIGGLLVLQALRLLEKIPSITEFKTSDTEYKNELLKDVGKLTYLKKTAPNNNTLIASYESFTPQSTCLACTRDKKPEVQVNMLYEYTTLGELIDKVVIGTYHFVCPDICLDDGSGVILWSQEDSDENDMINKTKKLSELPGICNQKTRLLISDLIQDKELILIIVNSVEPEDPTA